MGVPQLGMIIGLRCDAISKSYTKMRYSVKADKPFGLLTHGDQREKKTFANWVKGITL